MFDAKSMEDQVRQSWHKNETAKKITQIKKGMKKYYLLDGPPYVNGVPHVGHIKTIVFKDIWARFKSMQGYNAWFQSGFDCHGLPVEVVVEKELGIQSRHDIAKIGLEKFDSACLSKVENNEKVWTNLYNYLGAWKAYFEPYFTHKPYFIESGWWTAKQLYEKGMLVPGEKPIYWCPRCSTSLSGYEVTDSYKEVTDPSIFIKFPIAGRQKEFFLVWTTTPWTLISNVALIVNPDETYVRVKVGEEILVMAKARVEPVLKDLCKLNYEIIEEFPGKDLQGLAYHPIINVPNQSKLENTSARHVYLSVKVMKKKKYKKHKMKEEKNQNDEEEDEEEYQDFVTVDEGSGIVHCAPGHGPEDFEIGQHYNLPALSPVDEDGKFTEEAGEFTGKFVKSADKEILTNLESNNFLLYAGQVVHKYPLCWRCKSPLVFRLSKQWFLKVDMIKEKMIKENEKVNWLPEFGRKRFENWLIGAKDWCVSQQRFWGIPMPIWTCDKCKKIEVIGSVSELKEKSVSPIGELNDLHRHTVDKIKIKCNGCGGGMSRIPDIFNVWYDSGIAPWASLGYPVKNKELFERMYPCDMICEAQDQIRGWFYSLMFAGVATFDKRPYESVSLLGWVVDEKGEKMSKSVGNVIWASDIIQKESADVLRAYYCWKTAPWDVQNFGYSLLNDVKRPLNILWNVLEFYKTYSLPVPLLTENEMQEQYNKLKIEDKWLISKMQTLIKEVTENLEKFEFHLAGTKILNFISEDLSRWYVKLIRDRMWINAENDERELASKILRYVLHSIVRLSAPIVPFISEAVFQEVKSEKDPESVHICSYPTFIQTLSNPLLEEQMVLAKTIVEAGNSVRQVANIKLRWPVQSIVVSGKDYEQTVNEMNELIKFMLNAKELKYSDEPMGENFAKLEISKPSGAIYLNKTMDDATLNEALLRELIRAVQQERKERKMVVSETIKLFVSADASSLDYLKNQQNQIKSEVGASEINFTQLSSGKEVSINDKNAKFSLE